MISGFFMIGTRQGDITGVFIAYGGTQTATSGHDHVFDSRRFLSDVDPEDLDSAMMRNIQRWRMYLYFNPLTKACPPLFHGRQEAGSEFACAFHPVAPRAKELHYPSHERKVDYSSPQLPLGGQHGYCVA